MCVQGAESKKPVFSLIFPVNSHTQRDLLCVVVQGTASLHSHVFVELVTFKLSDWIQGLKIHYHFLVRTDTCVGSTYSVKKFSRKLASRDSSL